MSDDNVIPIGIPTKAPIPPEKIIDGANRAELVEAIVLGFTKDGNLYFASSTADLKDVTWTIELAKMRIAEMVWDNE